MEHKTMTFKFQGSLFYNGEISEEDLQLILRNAIYALTLVHDVKVEIVNFHGEIT